MRNTKLKVLAGAIALALAGNAGAATLTNLSSTGNSSLFFTSFDELGGRSYFTELTANAGSTTTGVVRMEDILANTGGTWTFTLTNFNSFYASSAPGSILGGLGAGDSTGSGAVSGRRILTSDAVGGSDPFSTNGAVRDAANTLTSWHNSYQFAGSGTGTNGLCDASPCTSTSPTDTNYAGGTNWGANWGSTQGNYSNSVTLDNPVWDLYLLTSGSTGFQPATVEQLASNGVFLRASLDIANNLLTIAPAPVPLPAAVWLFGSGLLGLMGISRRKAA